MIIFVISEGQSLSTCILLLPKIQLFLFIMQRRPPDNWTPSSLNDSNCLSLKQIVGSFSAPITEEHAWAIGK